MNNFSPYQSLMILYKYKDTVFRFREKSNVFS